MLSKRLGTFCAVALGCAPLFCMAANFNVNNPTEFQTALTTAQANGENDVINVNTCSGTGCLTVGSDVVYDIITPLTYTAAEGLSLTIDGTDSDTRILAAGSNNNAGILFINTLGAAGDFAAEIVVRGLTFVNGNNMGTPNDGGALSIRVNSPRVEVSGSVFMDNAADGNGGALFIRAEAAAELPIQIFDVTFDTNSAGLGGGGAHISASSGHPIEVYDIFFWDNDAANGGGLHIEGLDPNDPVYERVGWVQLADIDFDDNIARTGNGGGADIATDDLDVSICGFVRNHADSGSGAGLYVRRNILALDIVNAGFAYNVAGVDGGGFANETNMGPTITITNNTIYGNQAAGRGAGGLLLVGGSTGQARLYNNIIYTNTQANAGQDIYIDNDPFLDIPAAVSFFNNNITDLTGFPTSSSYFEIVSSDDLSSGNNLGGDPLLILLTQQNPDPSQSQNSQTVDAGDNNAPGVPSVDYEGDTRPFNSVVDIGMDEYAPGALPETDLSVTKTDSPDPVTGGNDVTYSITATNNGPDYATGVTITDTLDANTTLVSAIFNQGTPCTSAGSPLVVTCMLGDLAANNSTPGTIVVTTQVVEINSSIANAVSISGNETDPNATNNTAQQGTTVTPAAGPSQADIAVTKVDTPDPVFSGGPQLTYTVTVDNNGPAAATGVVLVDTLPSGVAFSLVTSSAGSCSDATPAGEITCTLGDLAANSNATVTIIVDPEVVTDPTVIMNTAAVTATVDDPTPGNNSVTESTTVNPPSADMSISTSSSPATPMINEPVTFSMTVTNNGPSDNTGVVVVVALPVDGTFVSGTIDQGSCDLTKGNLICTIGDMAAGAIVNATIVVTAPGEPMTLTLTATISADVDDPVTGNDTDSEAVSVIDVVDVVIQGTSEGSGSIGWPTLVLLIAVALLTAVRRLKSRNAIPAHASAIGLIGVISIGLLLPAGDVQAQGDWYVGANIGYTELDYDASDLQQDLANLGWTISNANVDSSSTAWKAYAGFAPSKYVAFEVGYTDLGKVVTQYSTSIPPSDIDAILSDTYSVHPYQGDGWFGAIVARWPVNPDVITLYAKAGAFAWQSDLDVLVISGGTGSVVGDESGTDMMYGLGFEWHINPAWSLVVEWERYELNESLDVPSLGMKFSF